MVANRIGAVRKFATRVMAAGALLALYSVGTATVTSGLLTATVSPADAYYRGRGRGNRGRGRGYHRGRGRGRGYRGHRVCYHVRGSSRRTCRWVR